ncbi:phosphoglucosamine mutase [Amycolatopsis sp. EV170708-02-1]|nr:phosphoglucosamine mutase [Amycolatopsis sp. EV170708-02-1]UMP07541.1 phosphoglucosamine mutase [Amycolatopsis sp. EV170708-02-1]
MSPALAMSLASAAADVIRQRTTTDRVVAVVGVEPGEAGEMLEAAVVAGLASAGADVHRCGSSTIPSLVYQVVQSGADLGVMISVPRGQVGQVKISFFGADGYVLPVAIENEIEVALAAASFAGAASRSIGRVNDSRDAGDGYVAHLLTSVPRPLDGLRVVLDCPAGAVVTFASDVYRRAGVDLAAVQTAQREDDESVSLRRLRDAVRDRKADLGITHDSEGRRCLFVDGNGEIVDGDQITAVLALALADAGKLANDTVVTTVMSNLGLHLAMRAHGVTVVTTAVGERHVMQELRAGKYSLGGAPFGAIVLPDHSTTSDGLLTALLLMSRVVSTGRSLAELASVMHRLPQVLVNVPVHDKTAIVNSAEVRDAVEKTNLELGDHGRVLIRPSGAEQLVRVMVEAAEEGTAQTAAERLAAVISSAPESPKQEHPAT